MTSELRAHSIESDATTIGIVLETMGAFLFVPRNTRIRLLRMHGSVAVANSLVNAFRTVRVRLVQGGVVPNATHAIWQTLISHTIVGTPANDFRTSSFNYEVQLRERLGSEMLGKGPSSNVRQGFQLIGIGSLDFDLAFGFVIEYEMIWIGGNGSTRDLDMTDEEENQ